uniref:Phage protein n=2 Tax=Vibrio TaxID=662 RepID=A0A0H3ZRP6_9VIBR|nr:Phage protein [Vibrio cyclitrophicus]AKN38184.1 hypothetical protein [Vibrio splendidus]
MPRKKLELEQKSNGLWATGALSDGDYLKAHRQIIGKQARKRRASTIRALTPHKMRRGSKKDLLSLGVKKDGTHYTKADMNALVAQSKALEAQFRSSEKGVHAVEILGASREIDKKRANNQVNDDTGITSGTMIAVTGSLVSFRVKASKAHGADDHLVRFRLETWLSLIRSAEASPQGYRLAAANAVKGLISFDCACERHAYWYRYMATVGNYALEPEENAAPKQKNPQMTGMACKHVLWSLNKLTSPTYIAMLGNKMKVQAKSSGYADTRKSSDVLDKSDQKALRKSRKGKINLGKAQADYERYLKRQDNLQKKLQSDDKKVQRAIEKARKEADKNARKVSRLEKQLEKQKAAQAQQMGDVIRAVYTVFRDANASKNWSKDKMVKEFRNSPTGKAFAQVSNDAINRIFT